MYFLEAFGYILASKIFAYAVFIGLGGAHVKISGGVVHCGVGGVSVRENAWKGRCSILVRWFDPIMAMIKVDIGSMINVVGVALVT